MTKTYGVSLPGIPNSPGRLGACCATCSSNPPEKIASHPAIRRPEGRVVGALPPSAASRQRLSRPWRAHSTPCTQGQERVAGSTLVFASQNSLAPRLRLLPQSTPQEPGRRNSQGVAGGKNPRRNQRPRTACLQGEKPTAASCWYPSCAWVLQAREAKQDHPSCERQEAC